ncbi:organomercurial lyase [Psychrobacter sp. I-STPA6b]|uniref:organomercurial lyase n=1 Tax=Psychrobacter sp. I-STPA6b TaxID=2585718 RepID=UPI001D0C5549|nr:organomercurial lyase [Psychrobacter sp. I-STPA6b]
MPQPLLQHTYMLPQLNLISSSTFSNDTSEVPLYQITMYQALIKEIDSLPSFCKQDIEVLYQQLANGKTPVAVQDFQQSINECCHIHHQDGQVTACFGCSLSTTEHQIQWYNSQAYAWCIWDTFFICQKLQKPANIISKDPISLAEIHIEFDGDNFVTQPLYFTFPLGKLSETESLRSCFCCRTKVFESYQNAQVFADEYDCEIVDWAEMLLRTDEMVNALMY